MIATNKRMEKEKKEREAKKAAKAEKERLLRKSVEIIQ
jgi:hypothetical protein